MEGAGDTFPVSFCSRVGLRWGAREQTRSQGFPEGRLERVRRLADELAAREGLTGDLPEAVAVMGRTLQPAGI